MANYILGQSSEEDLTPALAVGFLQAAEQDPSAGTAYPKKQYIFAPKSQGQNGRGKCHSQQG